jgi:hypothetical protein
MQIEQIVIEFIASEDRLLMSVHTDGPSVRIFLTRRYVRLLQAAIKEILCEQLSASQPLAVGSNSLLAELMHERAISAIDLETPPISRHHSSNSQDEMHPDMGSSDAGSLSTRDAWLAFQLRIAWDEDHKPHRTATGISIMPQDGDGVTFNLDDKLPHALAEMLARACESAEWGLDFEQLGANSQLNYTLQESTQLH